MIFKYANFTIDVDVERTRAFYQRADVPTMGGQCGCIPCQNFEKAILKAPDTVLDALRVLGIDPQKPAETFSVTGDMEEDGTIWYNGWYHICGTITESPEVIQEMPLDRGGAAISYRWEYCYKPDPQFPFAVLPVRRAEILHQDFPTPVFQLEIDVHLPYVLDIPFKR